MPGFQRLLAKIHYLKLTAISEGIYVTRSGPCNEAGQTVQLSWSVAQAEVFPYSKAPRSIRN